MATRVTLCHLSHILSLFSCMCLFLSDVGRKFISVQHSVLPIFFNFAQMFGVKCYCKNLTMRFGNRGLM